MKKLKVLAVGGGSGGHVTPVVAVLHELRQQHASLEVQFWCDRKFARQAQTIVVAYDPTLRVRTVFAGKFRRYRHLSKLQHITVPGVFWPNVRDMFLVVLGVIQSLIRLSIWRPDVVFLKGGYVCLPVGCAAKLLGIPFVIHDSDVTTGLTNRLLASSARFIATGAPLSYYRYPRDKSSYVGIPINSKFKQYSDKESLSYKQQLHMPTHKPLVVITGGGLGSKSLNDEVVVHLEEIIPHATVVLVSGAEQYDELRALTSQYDNHFQLYGFVPAETMVALLAAADVVVTRAGATTLLELAALAKPTVLVPSTRLEWQVRHAAHYSDEKAVILVDERQFGESDTSPLVTAILSVLASRELQRSLAHTMHSFAKPHAASDVATLLLKAAKKH